MSRNWNLDELYTSFQDPKINDDRHKLGELIDAYKIFSNEVSAQSKVDIVLDHKIDTSKSVRIVNGYVYYNEEIMRYMSALRSYASLNLSVDTSNADASELSYIVQQYNISMLEPNGKMKKVICRIENLDEVLKKANLEHYSFIFHEIVKEGEHDLSIEAQNIVASMETSGAEAWAKLKNQLIGSHKVNYKGENVPLTVVLNEAYSKNKEDRKAAYEAEIASYPAIEQSVAACLSNIKISALTVSKLKGYDSILDETLEKSRLSRKTLEAMLSVMRKHRPSFAAFYRRKAELLGYSNGLPWYEMYAPVVKSDTEYPYEEACQIVLREFGKFCQEEKEFMQYAMEHDWIDVYPKEGKEGGAFCSGLGTLPQSRIMLNYGNSYLDMSTIAHELGHGFHSHCMKDEALLNKRYTMPIAETASTFNEVLLAKSMLKVVDDTDKIAILEASISSDLQVLVDIFSRYIFETHVFEEVEKKGALSAERIKELMTDSQKEAYGNGLDPDYLHPYMWIWKPHYYYAGLNFYNFPYAFGDCLARGLYAIYEKEGPDFAGQYMTFLKNTGKNNIEGIAQSIGITLNEDFFEASIQSIEDDIQLFMELTNHE